MMKPKIHAAFFLMLVLFSACSRDRYDPAKFLSAKEQEALIRQTVYYATKLPPNATHETKFNEEFNIYYTRAANETVILNYYIDEADTNYFLVSRVARSITPMREGIAGKLTLDKNGKITSYEEVFRTWRMASDTLKIRGRMLFERMVKRKDLKLYYSKYQGDRYIEFPDERFKFDKVTGRWKDAAMDTIQLR